MFNKIYEKFCKMIRRTTTQIPLMFILFDKKYYKQNGKKGSCSANYHPMFKDDKVLEKKFAEIVDYIRDNYDLDKL